MKNIHIDFKFLDVDAKPPPLDNKNTYALDL
jgi:hypothetical protein